MLPNDKGRRPSSKERPLLTPRRERAATAALLVLFLVGDLIAVFIDEQIGPTDTTLNEAFLLFELVQRGEASQWFSTPHDKGPLTTLCVYLLYLLVGDPLWAARLLSVLMHATVLLLIRGMVLRLSGCRPAALFSLLLAGALPALYGWFRLDYNEPMVAVFVLVTIDNLTRPLERGVHALQLGLFVAGGLMSKLSFPLFILLPGLIFLATRVRARRALALSGLATAVGLAAVSWWILWSWSLIIELLSRSSQMGVSWLDTLSNYITMLPGGAALLIIAAAGAVISWRLRPDRRLAVGLLAGGAFGGFGLLVLIFDPWSRYLVPALPPAVILTGLGVASIVDRARCADESGRSSRILRGVGVVLSALLVVHFLYINLRGDISGERVFSAGMVAADRRPYRAYPNAAAHLRRVGARAVHLNLIHPEDRRPQATRWIWEARGLGPHALSQAAGARRLAEGRGIRLMVSHKGESMLAEIDAAIRNADKHMDHQILEALRGKALRVEQSACNPDDLCYSVVQVTLLGKAPGS